MYKTLLLFEISFFLGYDKEKKERVFVKRIRVKIIISTALWVFVSGVIGYAMLYQYLSNVFNEKATYINRLNMETLHMRVSNDLDAFVSMGVEILHNSTVSRGMRFRNMMEFDEIQSIMFAQRELQSQFNSLTSLRPYVRHIIAFNDFEILINAITPSSFYSISDDDLRSMDSYLTFQESGKSMSILIGDSIDGDFPVISFWGHIIDTFSGSRISTLYMELDPSFIYTLSSFPSNDLTVLSDEIGNLLTFNKSGFLTLEDDYKMVLHEVNFPTVERIGIGGQRFAVESMPLRYGGMIFSNLTDVSELNPSNIVLLHTIILVFTTSLLAAFILAIMTGSIITKPLNNLITHIRRMPDSGFVGEPMEVKGEDEISALGNVINDMSENIKELLDETESMLLMQKKQEIALLQSQVNPHFLYNTLDSIRWMAVIQKNVGIEKMSTSLSNLLRNLAKGVSDKITLGEELSLLKDYVAIQEIRYMERFVYIDEVPTSLYHYKIVKFSLQPIVENAIFHGIIPSGKNGTIRICAEIERDFLVITVEDDGIGLAAEKINDILSESSQNPDAISGMGVTNVDDRLKLTYGEECGLFYESIAGKFTRVIFRISKEI